MAVFYRDHYRTRSCEIKVKHKQKAGNYTSTDNNYNSDAYKNQWEK